MKDFDCSVNETLKNALYDIIDATSGYNGCYDPVNESGSVKGMTELIDNVREIAKIAILKS